jgi:hypothetical protein
MKSLMLSKAFAILAVAITVPLLPQVEPSADDGITKTDQETRMITPPMLNGASLPLDEEVGQRSNYLSGGLTFNSAYISNVRPGVASSSIDDTTYSIWPSLAIDQKTPRMTQKLSYNSGFTFYRKTNALDSINQSMEARFDYGFSNRLAVSFQERFRQNSNVFNQPLAPSGGETFQAEVAQTSGIVVPFEEELKNNLSAIISYRIAKFSMVGVKGGFESLSFPSVSEGSGLYASRAVSVLEFYSRRVSRLQYIGASYQSASIVTSQQQTTTRMQTLSFFYTLYSDRNFTVSVAAGPQHMNFTAGNAPSYQRWVPSVRAGLGWQTARLRFTSDYSTETTAGQGLLDAYISNSEDATLRYQLKRNWVLNSVAVYANSENSVPSLSSLQVSPGGHTLSVTASIGYNIGQNLVAEFGYTRLRQDFSGVAAISSAPDSDRVFISLSSYFHRPLGR